CRVSDRITVSGSSWAGAGARSAAGEATPGAGAVAPAPGAEAAPAAGVAPPRRPAAGAAGPARAEAWAGMATGAPRRGVQVGGGAAAGGSAGGAPAPAQDDPDTVILSDTLHYDDVNKTSTFTGNVVLTRGSMTLRGDKLVTREDAQGNQFGTATADKGRVVTIRQENPEKFETIIATGLQDDYAGSSGDITLTGQATVTRQICGQSFDN